MKLEIGSNHPFEIRKYQYVSGSLSGIRILYLSDFHYNRFSTRRAQSIGDQIARLNPNIILLGGDYADSKGGMIHFNNMMASISHFKNICAIAGNHDRPNPAHLSILCLHKPIDPTTLAHHYNLIFAGHLHGSQIVGWHTKNGLYPGRWLYKWNRLSASIGAASYLISKGLGDTLPIRYNCRKDLLLVDLLHDPAKSPPRKTH
jgi:hypothetical protein